MDYVRHQFRVQLDAAAADPEAARIAATSLRRGFARARIAHGHVPIRRFLLSAAQPNETTASTLALHNLWTDAAAAPDADAPMRSDDAEYFVADLVQSLLELANIARISAGALLLHHPFDDHVPACVHDAYSAAAQLRTLARRVHEFGAVAPTRANVETAPETSLIDVDFAVRQQSVRPRHPVGAYAMLLAVVHSTLCPQNRLSVHDLAMTLGDETRARRLVRPLVDSAMALEDAGATALVTPLRHASGTPHVFPACVTDAEMRAAQLRLYSETPLDPRLPAEDNAPWTAQMALLAAAHASTCPAVREYLFNYTRTADPRAARTAIEVRRTAGGTVLAPITILPAPRVDLPGIATRLVDQSRAWIPARLSPPRTQATHDLGSLR